MDLSQDFVDRIKAMVGSWPSYAALGSFMLYFLGYLSLRFHLTAFGAGTDLGILDERYLFAGAKFLVYIITTIPIVLLLALLLTLIVLAIVGLLRLPFRRLSSNARMKVGRLINSERLESYVCSPSVLSMTGIVVSLILIQFVMRQCFHFSNLLLAEDLHEPDWIGSLFTDEGLLRSILLNDGGSLSEALYFGGILAGVAVTITLFLFAVKCRRHILKTQSSEAQRVGPALLVALLGFLAAVQILLLPVNYGILVMDKVVPQVTDLGGKEPLQLGQRAWLVWEGHDGVTYLVHGSEQNSEQRKLVTLSKSELKRTEIIRYDSILKCLFVKPGCPQ
jgi:hypothetical protein